MENAKTLRNFSFFNNEYMKIMHKNANQKQNFFPIFLQCSTSTRPLFMIHFRVRLQVSDHSAEKGDNISRKPKLPF